MAESQVEQLRRAVEEARTLLEFSVTSKRRLEDKIVEDLLQKVDALGDLATTPGVPLEREADFWKAYQNLAQAILPVSAASIEASRKAAKIKWGATETHAICAAAVFLLLVVLQAMWVVGTSLRKDFEEAEKEVASQEGKHRPLELKFRILTAELERLAEDAEPTTAGRAPTKQDAQKLKELREAEDKHREQEQNVEVSQQHLETLRRRRAPFVDLIRWWYSVMTLKRWEVTADTKIQSLQAQLNEIRQANDRSSVKPSVRGSLTAPALRSSMKERQLVADIARAKEEQVLELKHRVDLMLGGLQNYAFPVLLGLLGALTFILRTLIVQIRDYSYTPHSASLSLVRISLGMMAGLLGGMLIPAGDNILRSLSPLAVAFLFGYAVEVVFAFLDRIVKAFVDENRATK